MPMTKLLEKTKQFEMQLFEKPRRIEELISSHVAFSGSPQMHPFEEEKLILIADPFSTHTSYLEFRTKDIGYVEELSKVVNPEGETVSLVRVWVRKASIGVRLTPFVVADTRSGE